MQINEHVEQHLRDAYAGAVGEDLVRMLEPILDLSPEDGGTALSYALFVISYIVHDVAEGEGKQTPTDGDLEGVAERAEQASAGWAELDRDKVLALLRSCARNEMPSGIPPEDVLRYSVFLGSYLLQSYRADDEKWWDYLDLIWNTLLAVPETTD